LLALERSAGVLGPGGGGSEEHEGDEHCGDDAVHAEPPSLYRSVGIVRVRGARAAPSCPAGPAPSRRARLGQGAGRLARASGAPPRGCLGYSEKLSRALLASNLLCSPP